MKTLMNRIVASIITASLLITSGGISEAYAGLISPPAVSRPLPLSVARPVTNPAYFTEQAMMLSMISQHFAPAGESLGYFYRNRLPELQNRIARSKEPLVNYILGIIQPIQEWSRKPVFKSYPKLERGMVVVTAITVLSVVWNPWLAAGGLILKACGNLLVIVRVKNREDLKNLPDLLEPGIRELVNRGVYSFGFSFQIPVKRKIPGKVQLKGFPEDREVIVWEYVVGKVLLWNRENALASAKAQMIEQIETALKRADHIPEYMMFSFHSRLGSVGTDGETVQELEEAAQPGIAPPRGQPEEFELRFEPVQELEDGFTSPTPNYPMDVNIPAVGSSKLFNAIRTDEPSVSFSNAPSASSTASKPVYRMAWRYVKAEHQYQMNGDLSGFEGLHEAEPGLTRNQPARNDLAAWLGYQAWETPKPKSSWIGRGIDSAMRFFNAIWKFIVHLFTFWKSRGQIPNGDASIQAMYFKMVHAERMPGPAIRYALFTYLRPLFRGKKPPFKLMQDSTLFFAVAYQYWVRNRPEVPEQWFLNPQTQDQIDRVIETKTRHAEEFGRFLNILINPSVSNMAIHNQFLNDPEVKPIVTQALLQSIFQSFTNPTDVETLFSQAALAFWRNTVDYSTLREIKPRVNNTGTQAADYNTVIDPSVRVETAKGQSLVYALGDHAAIITSDRGVAKAIPADLVDQKVKVDSSANESSVWRILPEGIRFWMYRSAGNKPILAEDIERKRLQPLRDPTHQEDSTNGFDGKGMEPGVRRSAIQIPKINRSWQQVRQGLSTRTLHPEFDNLTPVVDNLTPATELVRIHMQNRIWRVLITRLFQKGLPVEALDHWAWEEAGRLSRDSWKRVGTRRALTKERLMKEIDRLVNQQAQAQPAPDTIPYTDLADFLPKWDGIYIATGKTKLALEKSALSQYRSLGLRIRVLSGGELLKIVHQHVRKNRQTGDDEIDVQGVLRELEVNSHTPWRIASDSGAETYEANILAAVCKVITEEPFGISGTNDNHLVDQFGPHRVETTENPGSKAQDGMAAYVSMIQTLEEGDLWMTENITRRFDTGGTDWADNPFFKTPFTNEEVNRLLIPTNDRFVKEVPERLLGYTASGVALDTKPRPQNDSANLRQEGLLRAERAAEKSRLWVAVISYVFVTVGLSFLGISPVAHLVLPHLGFAPSLPLTIAMALLDAIIYNALGFSLMWTKRWVFLKLRRSDTKVWEGFAVPFELFVSAFGWVHMALVDYSRVGEGNAYAMTRGHYYGELLSEVNDAHRATGTRNTIATIFRSGSGHEAFEFDDQSADQAGRHFTTKVSAPLPVWLKWLAKLFKFRPVSPKVIHAGTHTPPASDDTWGRMARTKDLTVTKDPLVTPPGVSLSDLPFHVAQYYQEQFVAFSWLLQGVRIEATKTDKLSKGVLGLFRYVAGVFLGGYAVKSTQAPSPGTKILNATERLVARQPLRMIQIADHHARRPEPLHNPMIARTPAEWHAWPQAANWVNVGTEADEVEQDWREITEQPGQAKPSGTSERRPRRPAAAPAAAAPVTVVATTPASADASIEQPVDPVDTELDELASGTGRQRRTSLLESGAGVSEENQKKTRALRFPVSGPLIPSSQPAGWKLSETAFQGLQILFNGVAGFTPERSGVQVIEGLDRMADFRYTDNAGLFVWDRQVLEDIAAGVPGALLTAQIEMVDEIYNYTEWLSPTGKTELQWETAAIQAKVSRFAQLKRRERLSVIKYLKSSKTYDPKNLTRNLYQKVEDYLHENNPNGQKKGIVDKMLVQLHGEIIQYVTAGLARLQEPDAKPASGASAQPARSDVAPDSESNISRMQPRIQSAPLAHTNPARILRWRGALLLIFGGIINMSWSSMGIFITGTFIALAIGLVVAPRNWIWHPDVSEKRNWLNMAGLGSIIAISAYLVSAFPSVGRFMNWMSSGSKGLLRYLAELPSGVVHGLAYIMAIGTGAWFHVVSTLVHTLSGTAEWIPTVSGTQRFASHLWISVTGWLPSSKGVMAALSVAFAYSAVVDWSVVGFAGLLFVGLYAAHKSERLGRWALWPAALFSIAMMVWPAQGNLSTWRSHRPTSSVSTPASSPETSAPRVAPAPSIPGVHIVSPSKDENLADFLKELRASNAELTKKLAGEINEDPDGVLMRLWDVLIEQSRDGDPAHLSVHDRFNIDEVFNWPDPATKTSSNPASPKRSTRRALRMFAGISILLGGYAAASQSTLEAASPIASVAQQAAQSGLESTGLIFHLVRSGETLTQIARDAHTTLEQLYALDPTLKAHQNVIIAGQDMIQLPASALPHLSPLVIPTPVPAVLPAHVDISAFVHSSSVWDVVQSAWNSVSPGQLEWALGMIGIVVILALLSRYRSERQSIVFSLKQAVVSVLALFQLAQPAIALADTPNQGQPLVPLVSYSRTLDGTLPRGFAHGWRWEMILNAVRGMPDRTVAPKNVAVAPEPLVAASKPVSSEAIKGPDSAKSDTSASEETVYVRDSVVAVENKIKRPEITVQRTPTPLSDLRMVKRYQIAEGVKNLEVDQFFKQVVRAPRRHTGLSLIAHSLINRFRFGTGKAHEALVHYSLLLAEEDLMTVKRAVKSSQEMYAAAEAWNQVAPSDKSRDAIVKALRILATAQAAEAEAAQILNPLPKDQQEVQPLQDHLKKVARTDWSEDQMSVLKDQIEKQKVVVLKITGVMPPDFVREAEQAAPSAGVKSLVSAHLAAQSDLNNKRLALSNLLQSDDKEIRSAGEAAVARLTAASAEAGFDAAQAAADGGIAVSEVIGAPLAGSAAWDMESEDAVNAYAAAARDLAEAHQRLGYGMIDASQFPSSVDAFIAAQQGLVAAAAETGINLEVPTEIFDNTHIQPILAGRTWSSAGPVKLTAPVTRTLKQQRSGTARRAATTSSRAISPVTPSVPQATSPNTESKTPQIDYSKFRHKTKPKAEVTSPTGTPAEEPHIDYSKFRKKSEVPLIDWSKFWRGINASPRSFILYGSGLFSHAFDPTGIIHVAALVLMILGVIDMSRSIWTWMSPLRTHAYRRAGLFLRAA